MEIKKEKWKSSFPLTTEVKFPRSNSEVFFKTLMMEGWPSGQRQQTVNLSTYVYVGSNPTPSTMIFRRGCSSMVEPQPSKLVTWVRFPSPAPFFEEQSLKSVDVLS